MRTILIAGLLVACSSKSGSGPGTSSPPPPAAKPTPVAITIANHRAAAILVTAQTECAQLRYQITDPSGTPLQLDGQVLGCDSVRAGECPTFGGCPGREAVSLAPGATIEQVWQGSAMNEHELPANQVGKDCPSVCADALVPPPGTYTVTANAWSSCAAMPCAGDPDLTATATITVPTATSVTLAF